VVSSGADKVGKAIVSSHAGKKSVVRSMNRLTQRNSIETAIYIYILYVLLFVQRYFSVFSTHACIPGVDRKRA
jgi:hypothetical protein